MGFFLEVVETKMEILQIFSGLDPQIVTVVSEKIVLPSSGSKRLLEVNLGQTDGENEGTSIL